MIIQAYSIKYTQLKQICKFKMSPTKNKTQSPYRYIHAVNIAVFRISMDVYAHAQILLTEINMLQEYLKGLQI